MSDSDTLDQEAPEQEIPEQEAPQEGAGSSPQQAPSRPAKNTGSSNQGRFNSSGGKGSNGGKFGPGKGTVKDQALNKGKDFAKEKTKEFAKNAAKNATKKLAKDGAKQVGKQGLRAAAHAATDAETAGISAVVIEVAAKALDYLNALRKSLMEMNTNALEKQAEGDGKKILYIVLLIIGILFLIIMGFTSAMGYANQEQQEEGLSIAKTGPEQVINPETGKPTDIGYTITATYTKQGEDLIITDTIPDNAEFYSASGNYDVITKDGRIIGVTWSAVGNNVGAPVTASGASCGVESIPATPPSLACDDVTDEIFDDYFPTNFGCNTGFPKDPNDNCLPACQDIPGCEGLGGRACEEKITWYSANATQYGCNAVLKVTNPVTGKAVVVRSIDIGPACSVQTAGAKFDMSQAAYQAIGAGAGPVDVEKVDPATPLGPVSCSIGNAFGTTYTFRPLTVTIVLRPTTRDSTVVNIADVNVVRNNNPDANIIPIDNGPVPPSNDDCGYAPYRRYMNMVPSHMNYGDPQCTFVRTDANGKKSQDTDKLLAMLRILDPSRVSAWFCLAGPESGYNPNAYLGASTSGRGAYGLYQMNPGGGTGEPGKWDNGNVVWTQQIPNAVSYNNWLIGPNSRASIWDYWDDRSRAKCNI